MKTYLVFILIVCILVISWQRVIINLSTDGLMECRIGAYSALRSPDYRGELTTTLKYTGEVEKKIINLLFVKNWFTR